MGYLLRRMLLWEQQQLRLGEEHADVGARALM